MKREKSEKGPGGVDSRPKFFTSFWGGDPPRRAAFTYLLPCCLQGCCHVVCTRRTAPSRYMMRLSPHGWSTTVQKLLCVGWVLGVGSRPPRRCLCIRPPRVYTYKHGIRSPRDGARIGCRFSYLNWAWYLGARVPD